MSKLSRFINSNSFFFKFHESQQTQHAVYKMRHLNSNLSFEDLIDNLFCRIQLLNTFSNKASSVIMRFYAFLVTKEILITVSRWAPDKEAFLSTEFRL